MSGADPLPLRVHRASNTGIPSGKNVDNNGSVDTTPQDGSYANDSFGLGVFSGQFGMVVYSKYPISLNQVRTFQLFKWTSPDRDVPALPTAAESGKARPECCPLPVLG